MARKIIFLILLFSFTSFGQSLEGSLLNDSNVDSIRNKVNPSFWRKLSYGIGYEGGLCYTGKDLTRDFSGSLPVSIFTDQMYWINLIKGIIAYRIADKSKINIGLGYGFSYLDDRAGLGMYIPHEQFIDTLSDGYLDTSEWDIHLYKIFIGYYFKKLRLNIGYNLCKAVTIERLHYGLVNPIDSTKVTRWCRGFSFGLTYYFTESNFTPFVKIEGGPPLKEYRNNSPWQWEWNDKLMVSISGIYAGLIWKIGGIK